MFRDDPITDTPVTVTIPRLGPGEPPRVYVGTVVSVSYDGFVAPEVVTLECTGALTTPSAEDANA